MYMSIPTLQALSDFNTCPSEIGLPVLSLIPLVLSPTDLAGLSILQSRKNQGGTHLKKRKLEIEAHLDELKETNGA
jgi:hypothetical protein